MKKLIKTTVDYILSEDTPYSPGISRAKIGEVILERAEVLGLRLSDIFEQEEVVAMMDKIEDELTTVIQAREKYLGHWFSHIDELQKIKINLIGDEQDLYTLENNIENIKASILRASKNIRNC